MRETRDPGCDNDTVPPTPAQQARAARIAAEITARLADVAFAHSRFFARSCPCGPAAVITSRANAAASADTDDGSHRPI